MNPHMFQRIIWGLVLVTAGTLFLLNQMGLIEIDLAYMFSTYWPVILIIYGLTGFVWQRKYNWGGSIWSLLVCGVGTIFLLKNLHVTNLSLGEMFKFLAPVALILFGLNVIFKPSRKESPEWPSIREAKEELRRERREARRRQHDDKHRNPWDQPKWNETKSGASTDKNKEAAFPSNEAKRELSEEEKAVLKDIHGEFRDKHLEEWEIGASPETKDPAVKPHAPRQPKTHAFHHQEHKYDEFVRNFDNGDVLHRHGFIGDVHLGQEAWELKPIQISHFIGDSVIDLTRASIPLGETTIHVTAFIGDVKIFIPNDIDVEVRVMASSFIGDMKVLDRRESGFLRSVRTQTSQYEEADRKLIVTTSMFIGDITIKKIG
ncbi:cell wall-active antibiotics response protein LiaF [Paenibacillus alba]|uniref:Cell wall-active antibiotics response protein LiaF n=1 Tax=Paenibacillus alba TaxID=1197127 RepID=A0ABU6FZC5_9BACL|nr:cell wall-active antibiotics response protein LiaF [Paenibacillus alba]MEC0225909.1 cell wall-active antibiotics response protein LiaF [Paenibacillus alba]NQX71057.1 cell wall-active antibiotics response protein [Paenibacillus alba]